MSRITNLTAYLKAAVGDVYGWGAQGEDLTTMQDAEGWLKKIETSDTNAARAIALYRKRKAEGRTPIRAYDCSGLIVKWLLDNGLIKSDMSSRGLFAACVEIKDRALLHPGDFVFRHNGTQIHHVGVYVGDGRVIESKGRDDGVVERDIDASGKGYWNRYGRFPALQTENKEEPKMAKVIVKNLAVDEDVRKLQVALNALGYPVGTEDGKAGDNTMKGIAAFCAAHGTSATVEVPAALPDALTLAVEVNGKRYGLEVKAV